MNPLIEIADLRGGYGPAEILHGIGLYAAPAEIVAIIGPNGCGKSTLLKAVMGYLPWSIGTIRLAGDSLLGLRPDAVAARGVGFVPQLANVFPSMTVRENLEMGGCALDRRTRTERIDELVAFLPILAERYRQRAGLLSGGERQTVALAAALMTRPKLLLLDEPSAGLSPAATEGMFETVGALPGRLGTTILIVEQDVYGVLEVSSRAYLLAMGQNEFDGPAQEILHSERIGGVYLGMDSI